jgi:predicted metal-binding protein
MVNDGFSPFKNERHRSEISRKGQLKKMNQQNVKVTAKELVRKALQLGASDAKVISANDISVDDDLANLCQQRRCEYYGLSVYCPPNVAGPPGFRELLKNYNQALVFKIDTPIEILLSDNRHAVFRQLHEIAAGIEQSAVEMGFRNSKAYAGGSCKSLFCQDHTSCRMLTEGGECRYPRIARPSMSGFGINVSKLMQTAGWSMQRIVKDTNPDAVSMGMLSGLILIG